MRFYSLKFGLSAGANQAELIAHIKSQGGDVIQTSDGLCVKIDQSEADVKKLISEKMSQVTVQTLDPHLVAKDESVATDVKVFIGG